eukprot:6490254-Amphidinium_carterae.1
MDKLIGTPDETADFVYSVSQTTPFNQRGRTPWALADDHHAQTLSQRHPGPKKGYTSLKDSHNVGSIAVPVHPGNPGRNNDPDTQCKERTIVYPD